MELTDAVTLISFCYLTDAGATHMVFKIINYVRNPPKLPALIEKYVKIHIYKFSIGRESNQEKHPGKAFAFAYISQLKHKLHSRTKISPY